MLKRSNSVSLPGKRKCWPGCWCPKYHWTLRFSPSYLSKAARLPRKNAARSYEVLRLSRKIILTNLPIWCSKTQPLSGNPRPHLLTCLLEMSFCTAPGRRRRSSTSNTCHSFEPAAKPSGLACFCEPASQNDAWTSKNDPNVPNMCFRIFTSKFALRHSRAHFFGNKLPNVLQTCGVVDILTSTCAWRQSCVHFWAFRHWGVFSILTWTVLGGTAACIFSTAQLPKCFALGILTWRCASCHNHGQFFSYTTSKSAPNLRWF